MPTKLRLQRLGVLRLSHNYPNRGEHCLVDAMLGATDMVQTCDKNTQFSKMNKELKQLFTICIDQNTHIKRLEDKVDRLTSQIISLQDDLIEYRKEKAGVIPHRKLPMASAKAEASDVPDMSQVNRARIRMSL